jgi:hypothetical protein
MKLPTYRVGWQIFTAGGDARDVWRSGEHPDPGAAAEATILPVAHEVGVFAFEGASGRFEGFPNTADGHRAYAEWAVANRVRLVGDHAGPNPKSNPTAEPNVDAINLAVAKMAAWEIAGNQRCLGIGGSTPGQNPGDTQEEQLANLDEWLAHAELLNERGRLYQEGHNGSDNLEGARYYQHTHREWAVWNLLPDGHKYKDMRQLEVLYDAEDGVDEDFAFVEMDLGWITQGVNLSPGGWTIERVQDEVVRLMGLYGDRSPFFHVKDVGPTGGAADTGDALGDVTPFQRIFEQLTHPSEHEYLIERDGAATNWPNVMTWAGNFLNGRDQDFTGEGGVFVPGVQLDRSLVGAPGNVTPPEVFVNPGGAKTGDTQLEVRGVDQGEWVRRAGRTSFRWLRDEIPILGEETRNYKAGSDDSGKQIVCEVRMHNKHGSTTENTAPVTPA